MLSFNSLNSRAFSDQFNFIPAQPVEIFLSSLSWLCFLTARRISLAHIIGVASMTSSLARLTRVYPCPGKLGSVTGTSLATTPRVSQCCPQLQHVRHLSLNSCLHSLHGGRRHLAFPPTQTTVSRPYHCLSGRHRNTHGCHVTDVTRRQLWWTQIPSELRLKWLTLVAKFIATALVLAAVGATQAAFFRDDKKHRKTISLQSSPHVLPMPAR